MKKYKLGFLGAGKMGSSILNGVISSKIYKKEEILIYDTNEKNKDFIADMQMKQAILLRLINKLNDIEMQAMAINDSNIVFKCESVKSEVRDTMEYVRNLYM